MKLRRKNNDIHSAEMLTDIMPVASFVPNSLHGYAKDMLLLRNNVGNELLDVLANVVFVDGEGTDVTFSNVQKAMKLFTSIYKNYKLKRFEIMRAEAIHIRKNSSKRAGQKKKKEGAS